MGTNGKRPPGDALATALVVDMPVAREHAQWWNPVMKPQVGAPRSSVVGGVDGPISAWVADERNRALGQELSPDEEKAHAALVRGGKLRELVAWGEFDVYTQRNALHISEKNGANPMGFNLEDA